MTAKWLGVAPWDLAAQPLDWILTCQAAMTVTDSAEFERSKMQERRAKMGNK